MRHLYLVLIFTQQRFFLLSEEHFYTTVIILGFRFLFYCFLLFCGFALYWAFFFLFNRLSIFLIVLLLEGLNTRSNPSSSKLSVKQKHTHTYLAVRINPLPLGGFLVTFLLLLLFLLCQTQWKLKGFWEQIWFASVLWQQRQVHMLVLGVHTDLEGTVFSHIALQIDTFKCIINSWSLYTCRHTLPENLGCQQCIRGNVFGKCFLVVHKVFCSIL